MLGLCCCFSPVAVSGGRSLVAGRGLLTVVASLVAEPRVLGRRASGVVALGLSRCGTRALVALQPV